MTIHTPMFPADAPDAPARLTDVPGFDPTLRALGVPEEALAALARLRREAKAEIERLIAFLDTTEADPDLEDNGDSEPDVDGEPALGWTSTVKQEGENWHGQTVTNGWNDELELDRADDEPSLGSVAFDEWTPQTQWSVGANDDREDEHDGAEPDVDDEPDDTGIGDMDGLLEQCGFLGQHAE